MPAMGRSSTESECAVAVGQAAELSIIALPGKRLSGHVKDLGSVAGPPWDRHFDCKIAIDHPAPELRPGMSALIVITTEVLKNVLWIPAQALFERDADGCAVGRLAEVRVE